MKSTEIKLQYKVSENIGCAIPVIIAAAGSSQRMNGQNKMFFELLGEPVIVRTIKKFENSPYISRIIVVTRTGDINAVQLLAEKYGLNKVTDIVEGGNNRQASVMCGIKRLTKDEDAVLIHDGARPFVDISIIEDCAETLYRSDAVVCAVKIVDTMKLTDDNGVVTGTLDRSKLYAAQTPQGVKVSLYKKALEKLTNTETFTDDASIMEEAGYSVKIVNGARHNIKITTPSDLEFAEMLLRGEKDL
ncbi:MAG: 2-C-methyl-D-erythritol 4-phosphate cytidylyltransferase [Clostridia bacterium]|nr:2-C-methyl-D-erythritol 4-phosphate cytidylyltransferase [Clostridia bacterium]